MTKKKGYQRTKGTDIVRVIKLTDDPRAPLVVDHKGNISTARFDGVLHHYPYVGEIAEFRIPIPDPRVMRYTEEAQR